ncbi:MAG: pyridoxal-dependent decarboxylase, exosortase A system-associated [Alphaproteobacteria bacterium]
MTEGPRHIDLPPEGFEIIDGELAVAGRSLTAIVAEAGETPLFIYSRDAIQRRVAALRAAMPIGLRLHYAIKANPMPEVVSCFAALVDGLDVASAGELSLALDCGVSADRVSFAGPGKRNDELKAAVEAGILINLESTGEMFRLAEIAEALGKRPRVAVRVNPLFELRRSGMQMGGGPKPFGVDEEQVPEMLASMAALPLDFTGFHIFAGSQILDTEGLIDCQKATIDLALRLSQDAPGPVRHVNLGGGFGIPYFPGDSPIDLGAIGTALGQELDRARSGLPEAAFAIELGRFLIGEAGVYVTRIVDRKVSRGRTFLVTDGGLHHHLALSGNFGQVLRKNYPVMIGNRAEDVLSETVDIVGCLCTPLDRLGDAVQAPFADVGDLVVAFQSGAYGASASPQKFLGHPAPREILV